MARQSRISHISDTELANYSAKQIGDMFYNGNTGAGYNAIVARGVKPKAQDTAKNGDNGVKPVAARLTPNIAVKAPVSPILALPGRIEDFLIDHVLPETWDDQQEIPSHFVELVVLSDTADWNKRVRRLGPDELTMLELFIGKPATMHKREMALFAEIANAPYKASKARIDAISAIDAQLDSLASRFEALRYDAAIVAAYA